MVYSTLRQEAAPSTPPPIIINKFSDEQLRAIVKRMRDRQVLYKEKAVDQYASSPEISPPVSEYKHSIIQLPFTNVFMLLGTKDVWLHNFVIGVLMWNDIALQHLCYAKTHTQKS